MMNILKNLGLSDKAIAIYEKLLYKGPKTVSEISMITGFNEEEIVSALDELRKANLAEIFPSYPERYEILPPYYIFVKVIEDISENMINSYESISRHLVEYVDEIKGSLDEIRGEIETYIGEVEKKISESIKSSLGNLVSLFRSQLDGISSIIDQSVNESMRLFDAEMNRIYGMLMTSSERTISSILSEAEEMNKSIERVQSDVKLKISSTINDKLNQLMTNVEQLMSSKITDIEKTLSMVSQSFEELSKNMKTQFLASYQLVKSGVKKQLEDLNIELKGKIKNALDRLEGAIQAFEDIEKAGGLPERVLDIKRELKKTRLDLEETSAKIEIWVQEVYKNWAENLEESERGIATLLDERIHNAKEKLIELLRDEIVKLRANLKSIITEELPKISRDSQDVIDLINTNVSELVDNSRMIAGKLKKVYEEAGNSAIKIFKQLRERMKEVFITSAESMKQDLKGRIEGILSEINRTVESATEDLGKILTEPFGKISDIIERGDKKLREILESFSDEKIRETINELKNTVRETMGNLDALYKQVLTKRAEIRPKVWTIKGITAIKTYMRDTLKRTNHILLIVTPNLKWIPIEDLESLGPNVRVQIAANFNKNSAEDLQIINRLKNKLNKVMIRYYPRSILMGFIVDDREGLFAPVPDEIKDEEEDIEAIVSTTREYIMAFRDYLAQAWTTAENV